MQSTIPCCKCGLPVVEFTVPNEAWNTIARGNGPETNQEYLCLNCFATIAAAEIKRLQGELRRARERIWRAQFTKADFHAETERLVAPKAAEAAEEK